MQNGQMNTTKVLGEKINNQINTCLNKIEVAVKENKMNCIVSMLKV
jgi:hypothetical protein